MLKQVLIAVLALALCGGYVLADGADDYENKTFGFKFRRPNATWTFSEKPGAGGQTITVTLVSADQKASAYVMASAMTTEITPEAHQTEKFNQLVKETSYTNVKKEQGKIAGQKAPGLRLDAKTQAGVEIRLVQYYLAKDKVFFILQCMAQKNEFATQSQAFKQVLKSFEFISATKSSPKASGTPAARCGSEVKWHTSWDAASKLAQKEKKLVLVTAQYYGGFTLQNVDFAKVGPFMDKDIIELAKERFVVLQLSKAADAPFKSGLLYGMGPSTFGKAVLFATPDGKVVGDAWSFNSVYLYDYARKVLKENPEFTGTPVPERGKKLDRAELFLRRGELEKALEIVQKVTTAEGYRLKANIYRRLCKGEEALKALKAARAKRKKSLEADLNVDEAVILLRMGELKKAADMLSKTIKDFSKSERVPEAFYWLGACRYELGKKDDCIDLWNGLVEKFPDSRWAWAAAAALTLAGSEGVRLGSVKWPEKAVLDTVSDREQESRSIEDVEEAQKEAVAFLLEAQRKDGSWIIPAHLGGLSESSVPLRDATVALCGMALLGCKGDSKTSKAVDRAIQFLLQSHEARKDKAPAEYFMDYNVWGHSCMLWFFAKCLEAKVGDKRELTEAMADMVRAMQKLQRTTGGWSYYISASMAKGSADTRSISFTTAGALIGLLEARKSGVPMPDAMLVKGLDSLGKMRNSNGSYTYFTDNRSEAAGRENNLPGSAGRAPLCELALYKAKRSSLDKIRNALDIFVRYRRELAGQRGKALMHTGRHGQGSHYLMYDYGMAAAAVKELPAGERDKYHKIILELVLDARDEDGSYLDSPLIGRCYGTAMAILTFQYLK